MCWQQPDKLRAGKEDQGKYGGNNQTILEQPIKFKVNVLATTRKP